MALFTGTHRDNKIDRKGRVSLPAKLRAEIPPENNREIFVYPSTDLMALGACDRSHMESLRDAAGISLSDDDDIDYGLIEDATSLTIDSGGRINLTTDLLKHAKIDGTVVFVGRGHRFLIMSPEGYDAYQDLRATRRRRRKEQRDGDGA
ncbi:MAG: division/cell wall cluster transcriptional repressor MraZ [Pseudomonadota bacterium]